MFRTDRVALVAALFVIQSACSNVNAKDEALSHFCFSADSTNANERYGSGNSIILNVYQRYLSPVKGGNTCPMHPSCSQYAKIAFEQQSPFAAFAAVCDRYVRCGRDMDNYPMVAVAGTLRAHDPADSDLAVTTGAPHTREPAGITDRQNDCVSFANRLLAEKKIPARRT